MCWRYVGAIFRSWALPSRILRSCCVRSRFWSVFLHLGTLHGRFWSGQGRSGEGFRGFNFQQPIFPRFFMLLRARALAVRKNSRCPKTKIFSRFFLGFKHIAHVARKTKNSTISLLKPVEQSSPPKSCSKPVLERARLYLGGV